MHRSLSNRIMTVCCETEFSDGRILFGTREACYGVLTGRGLWFVCTETNFDAIFKKQVDVFVLF